MRFQETEKKETVSTTKIMKCGCSGTKAMAFQDSRYGEGLRVHNALKAKQAGTPAGWRCTCCKVVR